jgi:ABC-type glycerol-3-phosphate transport system permease component
VAVIIFTPVVIFALLARRHLIRGMTLGAVR